MNYKKSLFKLSFLVFIFSLLFSFGLSASAAGFTCKCTDSFSPIDDCGVSNAACKSRCGLPKYVSCTADPVGNTEMGTSTQTEVTPKPPASIPNPLGTTDINVLIARVINFILSLVGSVSLLLFVYGGITWMTSAGAAEKVKKGKDIIVWAIIGLAVVFTSYILVKFVIQGITAVG